LTCTKLIEVDRLGSGVRVTGSYCCLLGVLNLISARFQIFSLTADDVLGTEGNCPGEISGRNIRGNVLRSARGTRLDISTPFLADDVPDINTQWRIKMNIKVWRRFRTQTKNQKITGTRLPQISLPVGGRNPHRPPHPPPHGPCLSCGSLYLHAWLCRRHCIRPTIPWPPSQYSSSATKGSWATALLDSLFWLKDSATKTMSPRSEPPAALVAESIYPFLSVVCKTRRLNRFRSSQSSAMLSSHLFLGLPLGCRPCDWLIDWLIFNRTRIKRTCKITMNSIVSNANTMREQIQNMHIN